MIGVGFKYTPSPRGYQIAQGQIIWKMTFDRKDVHVTCSNPPPPMAIKVHTGRFIRKMTFDMKAPPVAIKVHTGRFIRKMTFDMNDDALPPWLSKFTQADL